MEEIDIARKTYHGRQRWVVEGRLSYCENVSSPSTFLFDTGADFTTISRTLAEKELELNLGQRENPGLREEWERRGHHAPISFLKNSWKKYNPIYISEDYSCACGRSKRGYLHPLNISLSNLEPISVPVMIVEAEIEPLLGRIGIFNLANEITLDTETGSGKIKVS